MKTTTYYDGEHTSPCRLDLIPEDGPDRKLLDGLANVIVNGGFVKLCDLGGKTLINCWIGSGAARSGVSQ